MLAGGNFSNYSDFVKPVLDIGRELLIIAVAIWLFMEFGNMSSMKKDIQIESRGSALCIPLVRTRTLLGIIIIMERRKPL